MALLLAALGTYGLLSYLVSQRTREMGIRQALGAEARTLLALVVGRGLRLTALGLALGLTASWAATRLMASLLYRTAPTDLVTFAGVSVLLAAVAALASWLPARRAAQVDPMVAFRCE